MNKYITFGMFSYIVRSYNSYFKELLEEYNLTQVEVDIIAFLYNNPTYKYASDIVRIRGINKGHASIAIEKLVNKGYLKRVIDSNCRRCNILLLDKCPQDLIDKIISIQNKFHQDLNKDIDKEDVEKCYETLYKMYLNTGGEKYER